MDGRLSTCNREQTAVRVAGWKQLGNRCSPVQSGAKLLPATTQLTICCWHLYRTDYLSDDRGRRLYLRVRRLEGEEASGGRAGALVAGTQASKPQAPNSSHCHRRRLMTLRLRLNPLGSQANLRHVDCAVYPSHFTSQTNQGQGFAPNLTLVICTVREDGFVAV